jgi:hypothetical protein
VSTEDYYEATITAKPGGFHWRVRRHFHDGVWTIGDPGVAATQDDAKAQARVCADRDREALKAQRRAVVVRV